MKTVEYADYNIDITSDIVFYDGHTEDGPSTEFSGQVRNYEAWQQVQRIYDRTINRLTKKPFGGKFLWELGQVIQPNETDRERLRKYIIYYVKMYGTVYYDDGTSEYMDSNHEYEVPVYNNIINWNISIE